MHRKDVEKIKNVHIFKSAVIVTALSMSICMVGCGSQEAEPVMSEPVEETMEEAVEETPETDEAADDDKQAEIATNTLTTDDTTEREVENEGGVDVPTLEGEYSEYDNEEYADISTSESIYDKYTYEDVVAGLKENYEKGYITKEEYEQDLEYAKYLIPGYVPPSSSTPPPTQITPTYEFEDAPLSQDLGEAPPISDAVGDYSGHHVY